MDLSGTWQQNYKISLQQTMILNLKKKLAFCLQARMDQIAGYNNCFLAAWLGFDFPNG
jgi:hypothetical protein